MAKEKKMVKLELLLFIALLCLQSESTFFNEPLNMEDMFDMFDDDGCTEGYLTVTDTLGPIISSVLVEEEITESNDTSLFSGMLDVKSLTFDQITSSVLTEEEMTKSYDTSQISRDVKSPLSSINELSHFNKIQFLYTLIEEQGPSHQIKFRVSLELGKEIYFGEGSSIKKAQIKAAKLALNLTSYKHPPQKPKTNIPSKHLKTPVNELQSWATNHNYVIKYNYVLPSSNEKHNDYDSNIYSKTSNVVRVTVEFENHKYIGEGSSLEEAKQNAAKNALKGLYKMEGYWVINSKEKTLINQMFNSDFENVSPISLLYEFSSKSKLPVSFDIIGEGGSAHLKNYVYQCRVGDDYQSTGEGSSKKAAKRDAAQKMIKHIRSLLPYYSEDCNHVTKKNKNKKRANFVKNVDKIYGDELKKRLEALGRSSEGQSFDFNSEEFSSQDNQLPTKENEPFSVTDPKDGSFSTKNQDKKENSNENRKTQTNTRNEFFNMAQSMGIRFQFRDFPKAKDSGFISLLSITTHPSRVCYGTGLTTEKSQDVAARNALVNLYKSKLTSHTSLVREHAPILPKNVTINVDEKAFLNDIIMLETL